MEEFSLGVFANADKADRESAIQPPDTALAGRFYIASLFFDVLTQFHEGCLPPDLEEKRRYAKYRTLQIRNRQPLEVDQSEKDSMKPGQNIASAKSESRDNTVKPVAAPATSSGFKYAGDEQGGITQSRMVPSSTVGHTNSVLARKKLQQAISAIEFEDFASAVDLSREAINLLGSKV